MYCVCICICAVLYLHLHLFGSSSWLTVTSPTLCATWAAFDGLSLCSWLTRGFVPNTCTVLSCAVCSSLQIQFLADCDHPNVVRYLGSFRQPDALWIVMEHCGGGSVGDLLQVRCAVPCFAMSEVL
jgi:hypothetical protein